MVNQIEIKYFGGFFFEKRNPSAWDLMIIQKEVKNYPIKTNSYGGTVVEGNRAVADNAIVTFGVTGLHRKFYIYMQNEGTNSVVIFFTQGTTGYVNGPGFLIRKDERICLEVDLLVDTTAAIGIVGFGGGAIGLVRFYYIDNPTNYDYSEPPPINAIAQSEGTVTVDIGNVPLVKTTDLGPDQSVIQVRPNGLTLPVNIASAVPIEVIQPDKTKLNSQADVAVLSSIPITVEQGDKTKLKGTIDSDIITSIPIEVIQADETKLKGTFDVSNFPATVEVVQSDPSKLNVDIPNSVYTQIVNTPDINVQSSVPVEVFQNDENLLKAKVYQNNKDDLKVDAVVTFPEAIKVEQADGTKLHTTIDNTEIHAILPSNVVLPDGTTVNRVMNYVGKFLP